MSHIGDGSNHWALVTSRTSRDCTSPHCKPDPGRSMPVWVESTRLPKRSPLRSVALRASATASSRMTMEDAAEQMGPVADAFALDQQLSSARAQSELDWTPRHLDPLAVLSHH